MIFVENITLNGKEYTRTYSDTHYIMRDGVEYIEAIDPINSGRVYTETDLPLENDEATETESAIKPES